MKKKKEEIFLAIKKWGLQSKFILLSLSLFISGCYYFSAQGAFNGNNYEIVKIEVGNKILLGPQELARNAKFELESKQNIIIGSGKIEQKKSIDNIDKEFNNLQTRANEEAKKILKDDHLFDDEQTTLTDFVNITLKSTFIINNFENIIYGYVGCNNYSSKYFWQDSSNIVISGTAGTKRDCFPNEIVEFENTFISNFDGIYDIKQTDDGYILDNGKMKIYLK